jgi:hypothetical protein
MPEAELSLIFVRPLNRLGVRYMISGGIAAILYGEPRLTNDVDFVVFLVENDLKRLAETFPETAFYVPPASIMADELARPERGRFNFIHIETGYKADFYTTGRDELNVWGLRNARKFELSGEPAIVAPPEYVILRKLEYFREGGSDKHLRDIRSMMSISPQLIDQKTLEDWIVRRQLQTEWNKATR